MLVVRPWLIGLAATCLSVGSAAAQEAKVEFNRDIRPILSNHCFVCHGPDNNLRKAKLRLDQEKDALAIHGGASVLVPGKTAESELFRRITAPNPAKRMPPAKHNKDLSKDQIELIRRWIEQGAQYQNHWSLIAPVRSTVPMVEDKAWVRNPIDSFILARLNKEGLKPSPAADRRTLLRRLSFDLTGLPPSPAEVEAFQKDDNPQAYDKLVDRLLASKQFGERMALHWLDLVRYADTAGYHSDNHRDVWLFRDWVIDGFNGNMPFDQFTTAQLAGDLMPNPSPDQRIASGYNRLLQTTEEGGAQAKEYTAKYFADRVRNVSTVWLGLTLGCSECHDHKFDPFTTKEFYQFGSFFADIQERAVGRQDQTPILTKEQADKISKLDEQSAPLQKLLAASTPELERAQEKWEKGAKAKGLPKEVTAILSVEVAKRNPQQQQALATYYRSIAPELAQPRQQLTALQQQKTMLQKSAPSTLVSMTAAPRQVRILPRGNWLDDSGEIVQPGTPKSLSKLEVNGRRATRLDLAKWTTSPNNPLTARVFVNRLWMLMYGQGIVKTLDDFGAQGTWPTHPELLDWLAIEFRDSGWNVKHVLKLMATANTYRQSSAVSPELRQRDPYNQFLGRQARYRLDAEMVRDNALSVSGLLNKKIGGPSAKPYQPAGYLRYLNFPTREWANDKNENQYRRGLYTYWQRTFLHPSLLAFDASTREECTVERPRSNTPQQALVLLNDPTYVEAARAFAERIVREGGKTADQRIAFAFRAALSRPAQAQEIKLLADLQCQHLQQYDKDKKAADLLLRVGDRPVPSDLTASELAAWTSVARVILNLHETITRE